MLTLRARHNALAARAASLANEVNRAAAALRAREQEALSCLACAAEFRDPETYEHLLRMSHYSESIARRLGLPASECELILQAARLHDVGKIAMPDHILLKPGALTEEEQRIMKSHTVLGHQMLSASASPILRAGAQIALSHHERFDGSGYPAGLAGDAIPLHSRIVAVADVFDALTSMRSYKETWRVDRAARYIYETSGSQFDPACVGAFFDGWAEVLATKARFGEQSPSRVSAPVTRETS
jgi:putative two-component system response regulator